MSQDPKPLPPVHKICLPEEVTDITRRQLVRTGVSMTAYVSLTRMLMGSGVARADQSYPPQRKLIWITMDGGWDILEVTDPKPASTAGIDVAYDFSLASPVAGAADGTKLGRWLPNIASIGGQDLLVVRGLAMGTNSHPVGKAYMDTSVLANSGTVNSASISAIVASESEATIPLIQLDGGTAPLTDRGLLKPVSVVRADNLSLYQSMYPLDDAAIQRKMAVLDFLKGSIARVQSTYGTSDRMTDLAAAEDKVRVQFQANVGSKLSLTDADRAPFTGAPKGADSSQSDTVALALKLVTNDLVTGINLGFGGFDTHTSQTSRMQPIMTSADFLIGQLVQGLRAAGKLDTTLIVMTSDFGRTPKINGGNGRDHWPVGGSLVIGGGIAGGRAVGGTSDSDLTAANLVDPNTGQVTNDSSVGVQLNPTHIGGLAVALTLGSGYLTYRPYLSTIPALLKLKGS